MQGYLAHKKQPTTPRTSLVAHSDTAVVSEDWFDSEGAHPTPNPLNPKFRA